MKTLIKRWLGVTELEKELQAQRLDTLKRFEKILENEVLVVQREQEMLNYFNNILDFVKKEK
jgi:hypothetical protein